MPTFGPRSRAALATCHQDLRLVLEDVIQRVDCSVLCGHRGQAEQDAAVAAGRSRTPWPTSRHNCIPSEAADVVPYPIDWQDIERFRELAREIRAAAARLEVDLEWGGDWRMRDYPHWQIRRKP